MYFDGQIEIGTVWICYQEYKGKTYYAKEPIKGIFRWEESIANVATFRTLNCAKSKTIEGVFFIDGGFRKSEVKNCKFKKISEKELMNLIEIEEIIK